MNAIGVQLLGADSGGRVSQKERTASGESGRGNLDDLDAVDFADDTGMNHLLGGFSLLGEGGILLEEVRKVVGAKCNTSGFRNVVVRQLFVACKEQLIRIGLGSRSRADVADLLCSFCLLLEWVGVKFRNDDLGGLTGECAACIHDHLGLDLVALVNGEGERSVLGDLHGLNVAGEVVCHTVTGVAAVAVVVRHSDGGDRIDVDGLNAVEFVLVAENKLCEGFAGESLVYLGRELGSEVKRSH